MSRRALTALSLARLAALTIAAAVLAVAIAIVASPLMPIGSARLPFARAPGVEVNLAILAAGFATIALLPLALVAPAAWRAAGRPGGPLGVAEPGGPAHASRVGTALGLTGSVTGVIGVRMAFEPGRGRTAVPVRSALLGTILAVAAVVAALVFGTSLLHLIGTPRLYGQDWQQELDLAFGSMDRAVGAKIAAYQRGLSGYAAGNYGNITVDGRLVAAVGIDPVRGGGFLTLLAGRPPRGPGEMALGTQTLRDIGGHLGQRVTVLVNGRTRPRCGSSGPSCSRLQPGQHRRHQPGQRSRPARLGPVGPGLHHRLHRASDLLQLLPHALPARRHHGGRGGPAGQDRDQAAMPAPGLLGDLRPAARLHPRLQRRARHPARARGGPRAAGHGDPHPRPAHQPAAGAATWPC